MTTILVPLDGSRIAEQALPYAAALGQAYNGRVRLLRAVSPIEPALSPRAYVALAEALGAPAPALPALHAPASDMQLAHVYLEQVAARLLPQVPATVRAVEGIPADVVVQDAEDDADMVVMVTHGQSGLYQWVRGSLTDRVVHTVQKPVLVVRATVAPPPVSCKRVLVALDGSLMARSVLPFVSDLAGRLGADLIAATVLRNGHYVAGEPEMARQTVHTSLRERMLGELAPYRAAVEAGGGTIEVVTSEGEPAEELVRLGEQHHATMLVLATHGYSGLMRWSLGSVADRVLHAATLPVLMVRAPMM